MILLAVLAAAIVLALGRDIFIPLVLSIVVASALRPVVRWLDRTGLPTMASAAIVVLALLAVVVLLGTALEGPVSAMASSAPRSITQARAKWDAVTAKVRGTMGGGGAQSGGGGAPAGGAPGGGGAGGGGAAAGSNASPTAPAPAPSGGAPQGAVGRVFGITTSLLTELVEETLLVFFLLAAGGRWMTKLTRMARTPQQARLWPEIAEDMHSVVSRYLLVTLLINFGQAIVVGLAVWAIGIPNPILWGCLTFIAEWVPYLGGIVMVVLLLLAGLAGGQGFAHALIAPLVYLGITTLQNNLVSPLAYGRGLRLNPTAILLSVMVWYFLWGIAGAFLAVPILASLRVLGSRVPALEPLAIALEE
jgi:predicted PurR-regulated permease PerM